MRRTPGPLTTPSRTVPITGTSSGLGRATARHFQAQGLNGIATMRRPDQETELTQLPRVLVARLAVQDDATIAAAVAAGLAAFGRIDVPVNIAGYGAYGPLEATPMDKVRRQFGWQQPAALRDRRRCGASLAGAASAP